MTTLIQNPLDVTPARSPGSARRTSHIDMIFVDGGLELRGAARDVRTDPEGRGIVGAGARVDAHLGPGHELLALAVTPDSPTAQMLVGRTVGPGFRAAAVEAAPVEHQESTPLALLLDDLPVAALISGYAMLYTGTIDTTKNPPGLKADICAGWRNDGTMMVSVRKGDGVPVPVGPRAPVLERADDDVSWHPIEALPVGAMRRRRLVEVGSGDQPHVWAMFRDSHVEPTGTETVLHEYVVQGRLAAGNSTLSECRATPMVLPWTECPEAAASADRLVGVPLAGIRSHVGSELRGTSTCTHLNDLLRSLGDLPALLALREPSSG